MSHFVLVPGAWLGGWAWDRVAAGLQQAGHTAEAVTLTGLADGSGPSTDITLDTHAADRALFAARARPHPGGTLSQPLHLTRPLSAVATTYLHCLLDTPELDEDAQALADRYGWRVDHLETGHWPMLSAADLLTRTLVTLVEVAAAG